MKDNTTEFNFDIQLRGHICAEKICAHFYQDETPDDVKTFMTEETKKVGEIIVRDFQAFGDTTPILNAVVEAFDVLSEIECERNSPIRKAWEILRLELERNSK